uniref:Putative ribonuclease III n=1 Tax=Schistosoma mansoni TaxID=6183 RepID=A0A3Q0KNJ2_SCHMA
MTGSRFPLDKRIIYISPKDLSSLPTDGPIYVLSTTENPEPDPLASCSSTQFGAPSQNPSSVTCSTFGSASTSSTNSSNYYNNTLVPYSVPYHANIPYPPSVVSTNLIPPYGFCPPLQLPPFVGSQPVSWVTSAFQNHTLYPPSANVFAASGQYIHPYQNFPTFQSNVPSTLYFQTFNPYKPPPPLSLPQVTSKPSNTVLINSSTAVTNNNTVTYVASTMNTNNTKNSCAFSRSNEENGSSEPINSKSGSTSSSKQSHPLRYTKLIYASEPDYFAFDSSTGSYVATRQFIDLEDRFENEVVARRHRVTLDDPVRQPPERPTLSDSEHRRNSRASHLHRSKKSTHKSDTVNSMFDNNSDNDDDYLAVISDNTETSKEVCLSTESKNKNLSIDHTKHSKSSPSSSNSHRHLRKNEVNNYESICTSNNSNNNTNNNSILNSDCHTVNGHSIGQRSIRQQREVAHKIEHPNRLHPDIWHNEANEFNDGPACSCKPKYRIGPLHNQYEGEQPIPLCIPESNNRNRLYHYRVIISPTTNFVQPIPSKITHNEHDYLFDGFSLFMHYRLDKPPPCQVLRFNLLYDIFPIEEEFPQYFTVRSLDLLTQYVFIELLELLDLNWKPYGAKESCNVIHLMPRFIRILSNTTITTNDNFSITTTATTTNNGISVDNGKEHNVELNKSIVCVDNSDNNTVIGELLPVHVIMRHWLEEALTPVINMMELSSIQHMTTIEWSNHIANLRGTLACFPGKKPSTIRIDQLDRQSVTGQSNQTILIYPLIVHMTYTPMKLSLTREPKYKCVLKNFMKLQYLMMNKPRISTSDRVQLVQLANELEEMEHSGVHRREITVEISCEGFYRTGMRPDIPQYALNLVSLIAHLRFHKSLESLENRLGYTFNDKSLLHQSLTHPSYRRTNFGTNQDHFQNSLVSCGPRILEYGDKLELYKAWRKKGLTKMIQVMSFLPKMHEERSNIYGNERLEFLGDAVVEVISSIHLFFMFPELSEGHLDAYRQAIVQNQHLAELAVRLGIHKYLLYTHSVDFCYDSTFIYARSDAFEALMAAITLDAGLDIVDRIFGAVLFGDDERIHRVWVQIPLHPLQSQCPEGDRSWATKVPMLKKLCTLEDTLGIKFKHLRVLARAMTIRKTGFNFYTLGDNQRLEFLGDSLLKYVSTDYLFRHFPRHHEGHLSLLKNSLVNKYTQASVCSELGLEHYVIRREDNSMHKYDGKINNNNNTTNNNTSKHSNSSLNTTYMSCQSSNILKSKQNKKGGQKQVINSDRNKNDNCNNSQNQNVKYRADLLEAFIGALFVDKDLAWVERFCQICFWPRLVEFILKQEWNDAKSKLQQCCLTFRSLNEDPEIAHYKVLEHSGPTNQRVYRVGVYFRGQRLATGEGRSVQQAQMEAAKKALELHQDTFRQLDFQRSVISKRYKQPYINKILDQVQNWDEQLVDYFISDRPTSTTIMSTLTSNTTITNDNNNTPINTDKMSNSGNRTMKRSFLSNHNNGTNSEELLLLYSSAKRRCFDKNISNQDSCTNEKTSYLSSVSSTSRFDTSPSICLSSQTSTSTNDSGEDGVAIIDSKTERLNTVKDIEKKNEELFAVFDNNDKNSHDNNVVENNREENDEEEEGEIIEDDDCCDDITNEKYCKCKLFLK